ncbi:MAG: hypothetical protein AAGC79_13625 [Pseudomonadota bacterium]
MSDDNKETTEISDDAMEQVEGGRGRLVKMEVETDSSQKIENKLTLAGFNPQPEPPPHAITDLKNKN